MIETLTPVAALVAGLVGSGHCVLMCGAIAGALELGAGRAAGCASGTLRFPLLYNLGRIASYASAGALAGGLGGGALALAAVPGARIAFTLFAALLIVVVGLRLAAGGRRFGVLDPRGRRRLAAHRTADPGIVSGHDASARVRRGARLGLAPLRHGVRDAGGRLAIRQRPRRRGDHGHVRRRDAAGDARARRRHGSTARHPDAALGRRVPRRARRRQRGPRAKSRRRSRGASRGRGCGSSCGPPRSRPSRRAVRTVG
jgi:hypothetical protein